MNVKTKNAIKGINSGLSLFCRNSMLMISSLARMLILTSWNSSIRNGHGKFVLNKEATILGNGPSLSEAFVSNEVVLDGVDVFCVNLFCLSEHFWRIKPRFYTLVDPYMFTPKTDRQRQKVESLIDGLNKVDWDMFLLISSYFPKKGMIKKIDNPHIKIIRKNSTEVNGFKWFRHWAYRNNLGMPRCQNVLNFAIMTAINMDYRKVYIYGADHTWTKDLRVDEDNNVCYGDSHVYSTAVTYTKKTSCDFAKMLRKFANMFESHQMIAKYAKTTKTQLINKTKGSFIDAYTKK